MEPNLAERLSEVEKKIDAMYASVEKLRKYFLWTGIITLALFILPLIGLIFVIPSFLSSYMNLGGMEQTGDQQNAQLDAIQSLLN